MKLFTREQYYLYAEVSTPHAKDISFLGDKHLVVVSPLFCHIFKI
jgi:hypothetical protein